MCSIVALTSKVGIAAKPFSLQGEGGAWWGWNSLLADPNGLIVSAFVILHFCLMMVAPFCLLCFIHLILSSRSPPLLSMLCWLPFSSPWYFFRPAAPTCHPRLFWSAWTVKGQRHKKCVPRQHNHRAGTWLPSAALVEAEHKHKAVS